MSVTLLDPAALERWRTQPLTYDEVGQTAGDLPSGYATVRRSLVLTSTDFETAAQALLTWQVPLRVGIGVRASSARVEPAAIVLLRLGFGPFGINAPCRVVSVVDEPSRQGFAYGTLPGHPESGEESFVLTRADDGAITFAITAFSRAASPLAKFGGPVSRAVQRYMTGRYLRSLDR